VFTGYVVNVLKTESSNISKIHVVKNNSRILYVTCLHLKNLNKPNFTVHVYLNRSFYSATNIVINIVSKPLPGYSFLEIFTGLGMNMQ